MAKSETNADRKSNRPRLQLPGDNRLMSDFAAELGKTLHGVDIFQRGDTVVIPNADATGLIRLEPDTFRTWLETHVVCFRWKDDGQVLRTMTVGQAQSVLASQQFREHLRPIRRVNPVRMPVLDRWGKLRLLDEGYDEESEVFTACGSPEILRHLPLQAAHNLINDLLLEFPFKDDRSRAVQLAAMLTVYGLGLLPGDALRPCFFYLANAEGAGKTLLAKCAIVPVLGNITTTAKPKDEEEMRKLLLTATVEATPVILLDNAKGHVASESLEGFLTSQQWSGRILGSTKSFTGPNIATTFITGNNCSVSPDLRRRALFVELFMAEERAEDRTFTAPLEADVLLERRQEILSALLSLVEHWDKVGRPKPSRGSASFPAWSDVFGGIVEAAGYGCPLETPQIEEAADVSGADMRSLVAAIVGDDDTLLRAVRFDELVEIAQGNGLFENIIPENGELDNRQRSTLGKLLRTYNGRFIGNCRFHIDGKGHNRKFRVERAANKPTQCPRDPKQRDTQ